MKWDTIFKLSFVIMLGVLILYIFVRKPNNDEVITTVQSLRDSIQVLTTNPMIVSSNAEILRKLKNDSIYKHRVEKLLANLQAENKSLKSMLLYNTNTLIKLADNDTNTIINNLSNFSYYFSDTIHPIYERELTNFGEWIKGKITLGLDTINLNLRVKNSFNVTTGYQGFREYVDIENLNPYTTTEDVRYYMHRASRFGIGLGFGLYGDPFMKRAGFGFNIGFTFKLK
jgi:hypothetical protein